jgi:hypothetical protein
MDNDEVPAHEVDPDDFEWNAIGIWTKEQDPIRAVDVLQIDRA